MANNKQQTNCGLPIGTYDVVLGESFLRPSMSKSFHSIRYDFKPKSVTTSSETYLQLSDKKEGYANVGIKSAANNSLTLYKGSNKTVTNNKECLMVYNDSTKTFNIEVFSSHMNVKQVRNVEPNVEALFRKKIGMEVIAPAAAPVLNSDPLDEFFGSPKTSTVKEAHKEVPKKVTTKNTGGKKKEVVTGKLKEVSKPEPMEVTKNEIPKTEITTEAMFSIMNVAGSRRNSDPYASSDSDEGQPMTFTAPKTAPEPMDVVSDSSDSESDSDDELDELMQAELESITPVSPKVFEFNDKKKKSPSPAIKTDPTKSKSISTIDEIFECFEDKTVDDQQSSSKKVESNPTNEGGSLWMGDLDLSESSDDDDDDEDED
uniref:Ell-associated factor Eaf n=1 Tax=Rhabditophanes sp. KR3021 TaxID=114890 RepID=A0AC35U265_9BILA